MSQHTPGPWKVDNGKMPPEQVPTIAIHSPGRWICFAGVYVAGDHSVAAANARLIASAPDLLEACDGLLSAFESFERITNPAILHDMQVAREAIAKARGAS